MKAVTRLKPTSTTDTSRVWKPSRMHSPLPISKAMAGDQEQRHQQDACKQVSERVGCVAHVGVLGDGRRG
ncbi:hypothetical protein WR25_22313 [Diploscapter pachys]|uniref:Uncharacterized protein n=1 Tax=Diploscapter pachys TaxID=2018661 RepID=A0A2A2M5X6_9BILA|nr:hypothetical protein WR25_22313 [Diploscapter pachys]